MKLKDENMKTTVPNKKEAKKSKSLDSATAASTSTGKDQQNSKMSWEKQLERIEKMLNNSNVSKKKSDFNPEQELKLLEKKVIILLKLKQWKEVTEEGYKILGKKGPNVIIYKCILVSLCRLGKFENDIVEVLDHWKKATSKCTHMLETKRIMDGYLSAIRSGVNASILLQNLEEVLKINSDLVLSNSSSEPNWRFRPPPSRHNTFSLCPRTTSGISCIYGEGCLFAHSKDELKEWQSRVPLATSNKTITTAEGTTKIPSSSLSSSPPQNSSSLPGALLKKEQIPHAYRLLPPACMYYLLGLVKKIQEVGNVGTFLVDSLPDVKIKFSSPLSINKIIGAGSPLCHKWTFMVASKHPLATVTLLKDDVREHFGITGAFFFNARRESLDLIEMHPNNKCQKGIQILNTFIKPEMFLPFNNGWPEWCCYQIDIVFQTLQNIPSNYVQTMIFDFKSDPKLVKTLSVIVVSPPGTNLESKVNMIQANSNRISESERQQSNLMDNLNQDEEEETTSDSDEEESISDDNNSLNDVEEIEENIENEPSKSSVNSHFEEVDSDAGLLVRQWVNNQQSSNLDPHSENQLLEYLDQVPKKENYVQWMNYFIKCEIKHRQKELIRLSVKSDIHVFHSNTAAGLTAPIGLFGKLFLTKDVNEDSKIGRLILSSCQSISIGEVGGLPNTKPRAYLCRVINKTEQAIVILIGRKAVEELSLSHGSTRNFDIWLHLDHTYLDLLSSVLQGLMDHHFESLFPMFPANLPWDLSSLFDSKRLFDTDTNLNNKQREAMHAIVSKFNTASDASFPIIITGPPSSGKSYLIGKTVISLTKLQNVSKPSNRILICAHSNEAADLFVSEHFHPWLTQKKGLPSDEPTLLRIYQADHSLQNIPKVVKKYCLLVNDGSSFRYPTLDEVLSHKILIVTVSTCLELVQLGVPEDTFSHIFIDEAERMLELETLCPVVLRGKSTKIILAGDPKLLDPELFVIQSLSKMKNFTLLERLSDVYPSRHPFRIKLEETYGIHKEIVQFISNEFYGSSLKCTSSQLEHPKYYPLSFVIVPGGEAVQPDHGEGYYNMKEIYEIRDRVIEMVRNWPASWGSPKDHSIAVLTSYADQALGLRIKLKLEGLSFVDVETLPNVLTKKYRVVLVSTVRTFRHENLSSNEPDIKETDTEYGFFTNKKAIHSAITRAQSLFMVVGDLVSLCNTGSCRDIWREYVSVCGKNNAIQGLPENFSHPFLKPEVPAETKEQNIDPSTNKMDDSSLLPFNIPKVEDKVLVSSDPWISKSITSNKEELLVENKRITAQMKSLDLNVVEPPNATANENLGSSSAITPSSMNLSSIWNSPEPPARKEITPTASSHASIWDSPPSTSTNLGSLGNSIWSASSIPQIEEKQPPPKPQPPMPMRTEEPYKNAFDLPDVQLMAEAALGAPSIGKETNFITLPKSSPAIATVSPYRSVMQQQQQSMLNYHNMSGLNGIPFTSLAVARPTIGPSIPNVSWSNSGSNIIRPIATPYVNPGFQIFNSVQHQQAVHHQQQQAQAQANYALYNEQRRFGYHHQTPPRMLNKFRPTLKPPTNDNFNSVFSKEPSKDFDFFAELGLQQSEETSSRLKQCSSPSSLSSSSQGSTLEIGDNNDSKLILDSKTEFPQLSNVSGWIEVKSSKKSKSPPQQQLQKKKSKKKSSKGNVVEEEIKKEMTVEQKIENLKEMGFEKRQAIKALQVCDRDLQRAVEWLIQYVPHKRE